MSYPVSGSLSFSKILDGQGRHINSNNGAILAELVNSSSGLSVSNNNQDNFLAKVYQSNSSQLLCEPRQSNSSQLLCEPRQSVSTQLMCEPIQQNYSKLLTTAISFNHSSLLMTPIQTDPTQLNANVRLYSSDGSSLSSDAGTLLVSANSAKPVYVSSESSHTLVWDNASTGVNGKSMSHDLMGSNITVLGDVSNTTNLSIEVSNDDVNWYNSGNVISAVNSSDVFGSFKIASKHCRVSSSADVNSSLWISSRL